MKRVPRLAIVAVGLLTTAGVVLWSNAGSPGRDLPRSDATRPPADASPNVGPYLADGLGVGEPLAGEGASSSVRVELDQPASPSSDGFGEREDGEWQALAAVFEFDGASVTRSRLDGFTPGEHEALRSEFRQFTQRLESQLVKLAKGAELLDREDAGALFEDSPELYFARTKARAADGELKAGYVEIGGLAPDLLREVKELSLELLTHPSLALQGQGGVSQVVRWEYSLHGSKAIGFDSLGRPVVQHTIGWAGAPVF